MDDTSNVPMTMLVGPTATGNAGYPYPVYMNGGNGGFGSGFGGDSGWLVLLLILAFAGGGWGGMGGFGMGGFNGALGFDFPWILNGQNQITASTASGFDHAATQSQLGDIHNSITSGFGDVQTALCGGFAGVNATVNGAQNALAQQLYTNQIADLERSFAAQTASTAGMSAIQSQLAQCCCDQKAATADVKYTIATEACNTRANATANTQAILDKLCALELDNYKRENDQLRTQLNMANLAASQTAQTAELRQSGATQLNQLVSELRSCPIPTQPVYGNTPIFQCNGNNGCGCNGNTFFN